MREVSGCRSGKHGGRFDLHGGVRVGERPHFHERHGGVVPPPETAGDPPPRVLGPGGQLPGRGVEPPSAPVVRPPPPPPPHPPHPPQRAPPPLDHARAVTS